MASLFDSLQNYEPITKGYSSDKKYKVSTSESFSNCSRDGTNYLLRISQIEQYEAKKLMFSRQRQVADLGVPMCQPIEFGTCEQGVYSIQSWLSGEDLAEHTTHLSDGELYALGLKAGEILKKIHTIPSPNAPNDKTSIRIQKYHDCGIRFDGDNYILEYLKNNQHLLRGRPQCFLHGDYHIGNMMLENGNLAIIDFDRCGFGDCWQDFSSIVWSAQASPFFATGQIKGYFNGEPPPEFFKLLAFYLASNALSYIYWAIPFGQGEINTALNQAQDILLWYNNMQNPVPKWYLKDLYIQWVD